MKLNIEQALALASDTKALKIGCNVLNAIPALFKEVFGEKKAIVVTDITTWKIAGEKVREHLIRENIDNVVPYIFDSLKLDAEFNNVLKLEEALKTNDAIPIVVGGGTLNDLTKLASSHLGRPYMCVPTAAAMDGYAAFGASITYKGMKQTFSCPAPMAIVADIEIIRNAPSFMNASGYGDLLGKITAGADWILADALGVEYIDKFAWTLVQGGLEEALSDPQGIREKKRSAIALLVEGLIRSGFAMQWLKSTRPASGAEHHLSHLWNMEGHTYNGNTPSHGFQVSVATVAILKLYEKMLQSPLDKLDIDACCKKWPEWNEIEQNAIKLFENTNFLDVAIKQSKDKYITRDELRIQLEKLKKIWIYLKDIVSRQLISSEEAKKKLLTIGAPTEPEQIGITKERMKSSFVRAWYIRSRFTILDVAVRTCYLEKWLDEIY